MTDIKSQSERPISIVIAGEAGAGINSIELILTQAFHLAGYHVFASKEYMSRVRGGSNSTLIRVGGNEVRAWSNRIDLCVPFGEPALAHLKNNLGAKTIILGDKESITSDHQIIDANLMEIALEAGNKIFVNTVAAGLIWGAFEQDLVILKRAVSDQFSQKPEDLLKKILNSSEKGFEKGLELKKNNKFTLSLPEKATKSRPLFLTGAEAVGTGALAGGCNFVSSYPMSPATGVLTFLAGHAREFEVALEQAEDEISAANMVLGAWYAGARGFATTSGGGFALMSEAISLGGMIETPMVIHLAQRPGPATGLPTRTEQGDLNLALYSGHGEFPRVVLAPGNIEQAFHLTSRAFRIADDWQVPAIILTDQHLMDSRYDVNEFEISETDSKQAIIETTADYKRYTLTDDGISPRGIPAWGKGLVCVDSDEHDESGHITESSTVRCSMVEKRLKKLENMTKEALKPDLYGKKSASTIIVCWGTTLEPVKEALEPIEKADISILHFTQLYPLPASGEELLKKAKKLILIEGNATGQFGRLIRSEWGIKWSKQILKYDGFPFSVEELQIAVEKAVSEEEQK